MKGIGGRPVEVVSDEIHDLFRRGLAADPSVRRGAAEWARALVRALHRVYACEGCGGRFVNDARRERCSCCGIGLPRLELHLDRGGRFPIRDVPLVLGRRELGGDLTMSREQVEVRRLGAGAKLTCVGLNSIMVRSEDGRWKEIHRGEKVEVAAGDVVRLGKGLDATVEECGLAV